MTKSQFLATLKLNLSSLPPEESSELMEDYEAHFTFGLQNGKTEVEIVAELGDPEELAKEALGDRYIPAQPVYWFNPEQPSPDSIYEGQSSPSSTGSEVKPRGFMTLLPLYIMLFFADMFLLPFFVLLWSLPLTSLMVAAAGALSPIALFLEYMSGNIVPAKAFAVIAMMGVGILLLLSTKHIYRACKAVTHHLFRWHTIILQGRH
ncbi:hypothetical protein D3C77_337850 [compost metagenome]